MFHQVDVLLHQSTSQLRFSFAHKHLSTAGIEAFGLVHSKEFSNAFAWDLANPSKLSFTVHLAINESKPSRLEPFDLDD